jgi:uncharacterized repeat protein (TIGR03803 family)
MRPPEMTATANLNLTLAASARGTRKQLFECALALPIMLGLAALPPSAQAQTLTVLHSFTGGADGNQPMGLVRDSAGNLYGTTLYGGVGFCSLSAGCGTVFKLDAAGNHTVLHAFTGGVDGSLPWATLTRDSAGNLYGATLNGGAHNCDLLVGCGTVFKLDAAGNKTVLYVPRLGGWIVALRFDPGCEGQLLWHHGLGWRWRLPGLRNCLQAGLGP